MWLVYLMALVLGGGLLLVQVVSGAAHGSDLSHELGADHVDGPGLLSTRSLLYALFTFGFVGGALHIPHLLGPVAAFAVAVVSALAAAALVGYVFHVVGHASASGATDLREAAIGMKGRLLVGCSPGQRGKVRVFVGGQQVDMMAFTESGRLPDGTEVTVVAVRNGEALVAAQSARLSEGPPPQPWKGA